MSAEENDTQYLDHSYEKKKKKSCNYSNGLYIHMVFK